MMFHNSMLLKTAVLSAVASCAVLAHGQASAAGARLRDWKVVGDANWTEVKGVIQANTGNGFLVSKESFDNFRLKLEFWPDKGSNSGVFMRCPDSATVSDSTCYEVNIFDSRPDPSGRTGAIVNVAAPRVAIDTEGRWNTYEILADGTRLVVKLNDIVTVDTHNGRLREGQVALQLAKGGIKFKNIELSRLPARTFESDIVGVWDLISFNLDDGKGNVKPWCTGAFGSIMYFKEYMSVAINCESDPNKKVLYSGPYQVERDTVVHNVKNYSSSDLKQVLRRKIEMPDNKYLNLIGPFGEGGKAIISWQRRVLN